MDVDQLISSLENTNKKIKILGMFGEKKCMDFMNSMEEKNSFFIDEKKANEIKIKNKIKKTRTIHNSIFLNINFSNIAV